LIEDKKLTGKDGEIQYKNLVKIDTKITRVTAVYLHTFQNGICEQIMVQFLKQKSTEFK